jgi:hypothetical protein
VSQLDFVAVAAAVLVVAVDAVIDFDDSFVVPPSFCRLFSMKEKQEPILI